MKPYIAVMVALVAMAAGTDAAILASRHGARPAVVQPAPRANPSPVLTSTHGGAR